MENVNEIMRQLYELQTCQYGLTVQPDSKEVIRALRACIPAPILNHYDRLGQVAKRAWRG